MEHNQMPTEVLLVAITAAEMVVDKLRQEVIKAVVLEAELHILVNKMHYLKILNQATFI